MGFRADNQFGGLGENIICDYLKNLSSTKGLVDVSRDEWFQQFDIDFLQIDIQGNINKIEVKTDRIADRTGNMVYEVYSDKRTYTQGCFEKTEADYIFYFLINTNILYIFETQELRQWVYDHQDNLKLIDIGDYALGYIIPLNNLKDISIKIKL